MAKKASRPISASGTVTLRPCADSDREVLLVHRPRYRDWSLPKGKINADEYLAGCAVRETLEETQVQVRLGVPLDQISYPTDRNDKTVSYWLASVVKEDHRAPDDEVDEVAWLPVSLAMDAITYADEREVLNQALEMPATTPLVVVRHAKAMARVNWSGRDQARPLDERGRRQSHLLAPLLDAYGVRRLASSTSVRCQRTLQPFAKAQRLEVEGWATLSEEQAEQDLKAVSSLMKRLARQAASSRTPMAICGHRPVLPTMLEAIGVPSRPLKPGAALVVHLDTEGEAVAMEVHKPRI